MVQRLYQLEHDKATDEFIYSGQEAAKELSKVKRNASLFDIRTESIQKVSLNPNWEACQWLASGGMAGLLRVEVLFN